MAERKWIGAADAIAQVDIVNITGFDENTTYTLTINGDSVSVEGITDGQITATALQVACSASTNPYFSSITFTVNSNTVTLTASSPGNPHTVASSVDGGTGTIGAVTNTTASSGPNDWDVARNWDGGVVPVSTDDVIFEVSDVDVTHGLNQSAVTLASLTFKKDYTGRVGLKEHAFATNSDGGTTDPAKDEYKDQFLQIGATILVLGENFTGRNQSGSTLIKIDLVTVLSTVTVHETAGSSFEASKPAIQLLGSNAGNKLFVRAAKASVGIAVGGFETATFSDIEIGSDMSAGGVVLGPGVTITNWAQKSGTHNFNAAADVTKMDIFGGQITTEGSEYKIVTVNIGEGSEFIPNHTDTGGAEITTINFKSNASIDASQSTKLRTFTTVNTFEGASITADNSILTITNLVFPDGDYVMDIG